MDKPVDFVCRADRLLLCLESIEDFHQEGENVPLIVEG